MVRVGATPSFRVIRPLGTGGTADVSLIELDTPRLQAALKQPLSTPGPVGIDFARLAEREWELIGEERFPGLVRLLGRPLPTNHALLLELCSGRDASSLTGPQPMPFVLNLLSAMALTLEFLAIRGIVHADIKPHNFFLPARESLIVSQKLWYAKLSDFSLGRKGTEPESARCGLGTPGYMPPESIQHHVSSHQSDLFALGVIAYQLLTGRHPFLSDETDIVKISSRICHEPIEPLATFRPGLHPELTSLVGSLLSKEASHRPASGWQVCEALARIGATYPYWQALQPAHLLLPTAAIDQQIESSCRLDNRELRQLREFCGDDSVHLRLVLQATWRAGELVYDKGRFQLSGRFRWPWRVRARLLRSFATSSMRAQRDIVRAAGAGLTDPLAQHRLDSPAQDELALPVSQRPLIILIEQLLHQKTIHTCSARLGSTDPIQQMRLALRTGSLQLAKQAAEAGFPLLFQSGRPQLIRSLCTRFLWQSQTAAESADDSWMLLQRGQAAKESGDYPEALIDLNESVRLAALQNDRRLEADGYRILGDLYRLRQELDAGLLALSHARRLYEELGDRIQIARVMNNAGNLYWAKRDLDRARNEYLGALHIQKTAGQTALAASTLHNISSIFVRSGRLPRAVRLLQLALRMKRAVGDPIEIGRTLNNLGYVCHLMGKRSDAIAFLEESLAINRTVSSQKEVLYNLENLIEIQIMSGQLRQSLVHLQEGMTLAGNLGDRAHAALFQLSMAAVFSRMGKLAEAERSLQEVALILTEIEDPAIEAALQLQRASVRLIVGDEVGAARFAEAVQIEARTRSDAVNELSACLLLSRLAGGGKVDADIESRTRSAEMRRQQLVLLVNTAERILAESVSHPPAQLLALLTHAIPEIDEDIECARFLIAVSELLLLAGKTDEAAAHLQVARHKGSAMGLLWELHEIAIVQAVVEAKRRDYPAAAKMIAQADQVRARLLRGIESESDRELFSRKRLCKVADDLREKLAAVLGVREGQGASPALRR